MERLRAHRGGNAGASTSTHVANMGASSVCVSAARKQGAVRAAWAGGEGERRGTRAAAFYTHSGFWWCSSGVTLESPTRG